MSVNQQILEGKWNEIKGKVHEKWGQVSDDELQRVGGNVDQLVGLIQRKTGESREAVERYLEQLAANGASAVGRATETMKEYTQQAAESVQHSAKRAADSVRGGYIQTGRFVRERPVESLAVCFGVGLITGIVAGLMLRSK